MTFALKWFVALFFTWTSILLGVNYMVDPLQYFEASHDPVFVKNQRYQIPGLIRNYTFDNAFIGTSHSENFSGKFFDQLNGSRTLNLAISGSSVWEQAQVAKMALATGKPKSIIWEMNYRSFAGARPNLISGGAFPLYLYEPDLTSLFYYLYSIDTLWLTWKAVRGQGPRDLEGLNSWWERQSHKFDGKHVVADYCQRVARHASSAVSASQYTKNIENELVALVTAYPQVTFQLILPPFSVFLFALPGQLERYTVFRELIYRVAEKHPNVRLFDFTLEKTWLSNIVNYKDVEHFNMEITEHMLRMISHRDDYQSRDGLLEESRRFNEFVHRWMASERYCSTYNH